MAELRKAHLFYRISPRKKSGQTMRTYEKIVLTKEAIVELFGRPISSASKQLGVSTTAMKKACRYFQVWL